MEISKSLQAEILAVQNKLKNAIRDHQICVGKLKDDPNNTDILGQIQKIHLHIVSLGRCQKQVVQRLRKEVETFKAENANGAKVSIASLLGLNNNNHITNNNETKLKTAGNNFNAKKSKEDYEEVVRNGDVPSPAQDDGIPTKERSSSVETISGEDDVIEVSMDENSNEKSEKEESEKECKVETFEKINFLSALGLITTVTCAELQNRRAERKRRSTANPQFVYSSLDVPTKRKRHSYLQSGNVPQTRQTTARMNGPSPPPVKVLPPKSTSPPSSKAVMKSLIPVQKSTTRPNILRNVTESKVFTNKVKAENGPSQIQLPVPTVKSVQSIGNKAVHIPGLPSSLTIERISNDSAVCITCRNPGTLTVCENCASNYHVSCHSISPAPPRICPKCALIEEEEIDDGEEGEEDEEEEGRPSFKKSEEFEEKERERYELRERNSDLRLQVYELEKRSQLLGQSLQLQHRTRQELLGKQEKTQRSIKRLVDFIKVMQLRKSEDSPMPSASVSFPLRPSSSQSPRTVSLHQPSTSRMSGLPQPLIPNNEKVLCPTPPSSSISCPGRVSPMSIGQNLKCPTPTSYQSVASNQKNTSHTSSSKKLQNQPEGQVSLPKTKVTPQCSIISCQPHQATTLAFRPKSLSPTPLCSSVNSCPTQSVVTVRSKQTAQYQRSTASSTQRTSPLQPSISWNDRHLTDENPRRGSQGVNSVSINCDLPEPQKSYCLPTIVENPTNNYKSQSQPSQRRQPCSVVVQSTGQEPVVFSTHCSQAITSPISSPIILETYETSVQLTKTLSSVDNNCIKTTSWNQTNETSLRSNCNAVPSQNSSST